MKKETPKKAPSDLIAEKDNTLPLPPKQPVNFWREALITVVLLAGAFGVAKGATAYMIQPYVVDGQSMETTLQDNDRLLVDKLPLTFAHLRNHQYIPKRGDIIIFNQSGLPGYYGTKQLIKRVIGLPGDKVVVDNGTITIFNSSHPKGFQPDSTGKYRVVSPTTRSVNLTLGNDQLFVCGDNRPYSEDSRAFGPINSSQIVGKLSFRIFPFNKLSHY